MKWWTRKWTVVIAVAVALLVAFPATMFADHKQFIPIIWIPGSGGGGGGGTVTPVPPTPEPPVTETPDPSVTETPVPTCNGAWNEYVPPVVGSLKVAPNYPVVVGQDPDARGVDLEISGGRGGYIRHHYQHLDVVGYKDRCIHDDNPPPDWTGCDADTDHDGHPDHPNDPHWNKIQDPIYQCRWHVSVINDPVTRHTIKVTLTPGSVNWIEHDLAQKYPGAAVKGEYPMPISWKYQLGMVPWFQAKTLQVRDPGRYQIHVEYVTSRGQRAEKDMFFKVWLLRDTLWK